MLITNTMLIILTKLFLTAHVVALFLYAVNCLYCTIRYRFLTEQDFVNDGYKGTITLRRYLADSYGSIIGFFLAIAFGIIWIVLGIAWLFYITIYFLFPELL